MAALWTMLGLSSPATAESAGQVIKMRGEAKLVRGESSVPMKLGYLLEPGDRISTRTDARLKIQYVDGSTTTLGEESTLTIKRFDHAPEGGGRNAVLWLNRGIVNVTTAAAKAAGAKSSFIVHTNHAFAATRGTQWIVIAAPDSSDICVLKGQVSVGLEGKTRRAALTAGSGTWVPVDAATGIDKSLAIPDDILSEMLAATSEDGEAISYNPAAAPPLVLPSPEAGRQPKAETEPEPEEQKPIKQDFYRKKPEK